MSDTPRTDAEGCYPDDACGEAVDADFARTLERELTAAKAEVERLREDAERYQWLRGPLVGRGIRVIMPTPYLAILSGAELDREIDAALKEGQR
jgi:hypothetical protein